MWGDSARTVLCVDDYQPLLQTLQAVLPSFVYRVLTALTIEEALRLTSATSVDVVLLDAHLCPACGMTENACFSERIRAFRPDVRVMVWSSDPEELRAVRSCSGVRMMKPVEPEELARQIDEVLSGFSG